MNEPAVINLTINGRAVQARAGQTVYEAAAAAGIPIPVLCHHPRLKPHGACRICLVEIEKQRGLHPSCTYPVTEGMVVRTDTPAVVASRQGFAASDFFRTDALLHVLSRERQRRDDRLRIGRNSVTSTDWIAGTTPRITGSNGRWTPRGDFS